MVLYSTLKGDHLICLVCAVPTCKRDLLYPFSYAIMEENGTSPSKVSHLENECLDPRVQVELENLNAATDEINRLEATLEEANNAFRGSLNETSAQLQALSKKLGSCVEKARPFYEAKESAKKLQLECQRAAVQYQRANAVHQAARETIALAEERFANLKEREKQGGKERKFDSAWQEMLNHATLKIMEAEAQKSASEREHLRRAAAYTAAEKELQDLQRRLKSAINKSRPYFSHRAATQVKLETQKDRIHKLQKDIVLAKNKYSFSLRNLEHISEEIHELRRVNMKREPGVGAEVDECEPFIEKAPSRESLLDSSSEEEHKYWNTLKVKLNELKDVCDSASSGNEEFKENFSILVHEDDLSIPYKDSPKDVRKANAGHTNRSAGSVRAIQVEKIKAKADGQKSVHANLYHIAFDVTDDIQLEVDSISEGISLSGIVCESVRSSTLPLLALKDGGARRPEGQDPDFGLPREANFVKNSVKRIERLFSKESDTLNNEGKKSDKPGNDDKDNDKPITEDRESKQTLSNEDNSAL